VPGLKQTSTGRRDLVECQPNSGRFFTVQLSFHPRSTIILTYSESTWSSPSANVIKRHACASHLASLLREVVSHPETLANWISVFNWPAFILQPPKRGGRRHNLTATIRSQISTFSGSAPQVPMKQAKAKAAPTGSQASMNLTLLSQVVTAKLKDDNIRTAIRILNSEDTPEPPLWHLCSSFRKNTRLPLAWTLRSLCRHNFLVSQLTRMKCAKQHFPFLRVPLLVLMACDRSTYVT